MSDAAIVLFAAIGLALTLLLIVADTMRRRTPTWPAAAAIR